MQECVRDYTVCLLFTPDLQQVLLQVKKKTDFAGLLNGVGGKLEPGETPEQCARREIFEETGLDNIRHLTWIGTLELPDNCDNHATSTDPMDPAVILYFYAGIYDPQEKQPIAPESGEVLTTHFVNAVLKCPVTHDVYAGYGNIQYFVRLGTMALAMYKEGTYGTIGSC